MRRNELTIVLVLAVIGVIAAFWLVVLSPKRDEASSLNQDIDGLQASLVATEQAVAAGEQARDEFGVNYRSLVVLGKAVPADGDQAGLLVQVQRLADRAGIEFQSIDLASGGQSASTPTTPASGSEDAPEAPVKPSTEGVEDSATTTSTTSSTAPATEAAAATLPIGASVGTAGLPVMPYDLKFTGDFFEIADFLESLDAMVEVPRSEVDVTGRLLTVDGFALAPADSASGASISATPTLTATLAVTTFLAPADQGIAAGATVTGPAPDTSTVASTTTPAPASTSSEPAPAP